VAEAEETEALYAPPTHLSTSGSIGLIPDRTFYVMLSAFMLALVPAFVGFKVWGLWGITVGLIPITLSTPFALWFLSPPFEHGLVQWPRYTLSRKVLLSQHHAWLRDVRIEDGVICLGRGKRREYRAVIMMATVNLDLASVAGKRRHRGQIGRILDGIGYPVQIVVRAETLPFVSSLERMRLHRNPHSRQLADWLAEHHKAKQAIDRRRYLIIPASSLDVLEERVGNVMRSFAQANLDAVRVDDQADLREILNTWWTWRADPERLGPERVDRHVREVQSDGRFARVYALNGVPGAITTNWWQRLLDGDLAIDMSIALEQQDLVLAKWRLDLKLNNLMSSSFSAGRMVAIEQVKQLRRDMEGRTRPWNMQVLLVIRGADKAQLERACSTFEQQIKDLGAKVNLLRWEQYEGMVSAQPLCLGTLPYRPLYVESGTVARCTPFSAATLQMLDGIPWGLAGSAPILLTTKNAKTGKHFGWFGFTGSGKGFAARMYLARRHFADRLRVFMWDADEVSHEYSGRFCEFLGGVALKIDSLEEMKRVQLDPLWQVVAVDVSDMPEHEQPAAFATWKHIVEKHVLEFPGETAFLVDEATTIAEARDQSGAMALGNAVQTWRKRGFEVHVITQRVSDWFDTRIGRKIQGSLAVKVYGAQEESEIYDVAKRVRWSDEERERISTAGIGNFLVVAFGRRVWADLYDHVADYEYAAYSTDPPERVEILATRRAVA
jgi:hypothetical protein